LTAQRAQLQLEGDSDKVQLRAQLQDGVCRVDIEPGKTLGARLRSAAGFAGSERLALIGLQGDGLARAALVTPIGLIELRAQADGSLAGRYGTRPLRLRFAGSTAGEAGAGS
jgi:hypothetical protein